MTGKIFPFLCGWILAAGCSEDTPEIDTLCLRDNIGNYVIKWETDMKPEGKVDIYVSPDPNVFEAQAALSTTIGNGTATYITPDNVTRQYFRMLFDNKHSRVVGERLVEMDSVLNLRDMGGYSNDQQRMTRWGMVYRSGDLSRLSSLDSLRLQALGAKTVIDLRSAEEMQAAPLTFAHTHIVRLPVTNSTMETIHLALRDGRMRKGDATVYMQDLYLHFLTDNTASFAQALHLFLEEDNYPILFCCSLGKDACGFLANMLLSSLSVPDETISYDYLASNDHLPLHRFVPLAEGLTPDTEQAVLVLLCADESFLNPFRQKIQADYGTVTHYLDSALHFNRHKRVRLQEILLYP